jgi:hypothetical protein
MCLQQQFNNHGVGTKVMYPMEKALEKWRKIA